MNYSCACEVSLTQRRQVRKVLFIFYCEMTVQLDGEDNLKPRSSAYTTPGIRSSVPRSGISQSSNELRDLW